MILRIFDNPNQLSQFILHKRITALDALAMVETYTVSVSDNSAPTGEIKYYVAVDSILTDSQILLVCGQIATSIETDTLNKYLIAKSIAKSIPNWATWTQTDWANYFDANLSDAQVDLVTTLATARVMLKRQNLVMQNLVKLLIAIRDDIWPDLSEP